MATCASCGMEIYGDDVSNSESDGATGATFCSKCAKLLMPHVTTDRPNLPRAALFGLVAAVVSAVVWFGVVAVTHYELGIVAVIVGWLVATAVLRGGGGRPAWSLRLVSVTMALFAMTLAEYLIMWQALGAVVAKQGEGEIGLLLPLDLAAELVWVGISSDPMSLLFWAIALYEAFVIPGRKKRLPEPQPQGVPM